MGRKKNLYIKNASEPFRLSRSKIDMFLRCPRCFYLDRRLGISPPPQIPFSINNGIDKLFKKEFDKYREEQKPHPLFDTIGLKAVPWKSDLLERWQNFHFGIGSYLSDFNIEVYGAVDDIWEADDKELIMADYKATSTEKEITLDDKWKDGYKRQIEMYQWLLRKNGYKVSNKAYFVYTNGLTSADSFNDKMQFSTKLLEYVGDSSWVDGVIRNIWECLESDIIPNANDKCELCGYINKVKGY